MTLAKIIGGLFILVASLGSASAQSPCNGQPASGLVCGNPTASPTLPSWATQTALIDRAFTAAQGQILNRGASAWTSTATPSLGKNGGTGGAITLNGATSGSVTIGAKAAAGTATIFNLPITNGALNQVLITDGSGNTSWTNAGSGTVSSVGLSMPGIFTVTGSPVTGAGTLTATLNTESANQIWAGPTTGAASAPTFRALVGADLPNPSSSTLGGIQSFAGVSSQWIRQISTFGVPTASQPAFTDISGTLAPAQCPNPSASTIGCVESYVTVPHQWINAISTSGVPSSTQPNFADLSGSATLGQLPTIGNNSILANNSGGTAIPSSLTPSQILDMINNVQGDILYRNVSGWVVLAPGTSGQVLTTGGAAANPAWATISGTGTVTNVATGTGLTGGPITTTGTISLANVANLSVLANVSGGSAPPTANTMTAILDAALGSTQGNILYRGASNWTVLAPGTNGQVLTQGASTPAWSSSGSVTAVATGQGLSGGTITTSGTLTTSAGVNTNTLNTQTLPYTILNTDKGKTVNIAGGPGTLTLPSVSGFASDFVMQACNTATANSSNHAIILSGWPAPSLAHLWMQQCEEVSIVNGAWQVSKLPGPFKPTFGLSCYADSGGNNNNDGLVSNAAANAVVDPQQCINIWRNEIDRNYLGQPIVCLTGGQTYNQSTLGPLTLATFPLIMNVETCSGGSNAILRSTASNIITEQSDFGGYIIFGLAGTSGVTLDCTSAASHPCYAVYNHQQGGWDFYTTSGSMLIIGANALDYGIYSDSLGKFNGNTTSGITFQGPFADMIHGEFGSMMDFVGINLASSASTSGSVIRMAQNSTATLSGTLASAGSGVTSIHVMFTATNSANILLASNFNPTGSIGGSPVQYFALNFGTVCNASASAIPGSTGQVTAGGWNAGGAIASGGTCLP